MKNEFAKLKKAIIFKNRWKSHRLAL